MNKTKKYKGDGLPRYHLTKPVGYINSNLPVYINSNLPVYFATDESKRSYDVDDDQIVLIYQFDEQYLVNIRQIPNKFKKLGIQNLYRVELSNYWRMLYTIEGTTIEIFLFVLNIVDHKDYNKLFGYKG